MIPPAEIEAVLLSSPRPVPLSTLLSVTGLPRGEALAALDALKSRFSPETSGIVLRETAGGYQLATKPDMVGVFGVIILEQAKGACLHTMQKPPVVIVFTVVLGITSFEYHEALRVCSLE